MKIIRSIRLLIVRNKSFFLLPAYFSLIFFIQCGSTDSKDKSDLELAQEIITKAGGVIVESDNELDSDDFKNITATISPRGISNAELQKIVTSFIDKYSDLEKHEECSNIEYGMSSEFRCSFLREDVYFALSLHTHNSSDGEEQYLTIIWGIPLAPIDKQTYIINDRIEEVKKRLIDIRDAQIAYHSRFDVYANNFDDLISFILFDSISVNSKWINVTDSLFSSLTYPIDSMPYIPYSQGKKFDIEAGFIERGLVKFPVFEVKAEPEYYLTGLDHNINEFVPLRIGSMLEAHTKVSWK